ncbi:MAG: O-methyltransferase [Bacteroidetes bacterium]|nr:MAG: O-methyltransferase [Bacteroidota bacterium]
MSKLTEKPQFDTTNPDFEAYALEFTSPEADLLIRLARETHFVSTTPGMLSGNLQGKLLMMLSRLMQPVSILEIGTFTGYSAICLAHGLRPEGVLHTIDNNPEVAHIAGKFFEESGFEHQIIQHQGNAMDILPSLSGPFDLVFIDADKENYVNYYEVVFPKVRKGGIIIADNVLWYGKVIEPDALNDKETRGIVAFNNHVKSDPGVEHLLLPVRDGLMLVRKM